MNNSIKDLEAKIQSWTKSLEKTKNPVVSASLSEKINDAKKEIARINAEKNAIDKKTLTHVDAPCVADKNEHTVLNRAQITNTGEVFAYLD